VAVVAAWGGGTWGASSKCVAAVVCTVGGSAGRIGCAACGNGDAAPVPVTGAMAMRGIGVPPARSMCQRVKAVCDCVVCDKLHGAT
jgi:hypothetical protein